MKNCDGNMAVFTFFDVSGFGNAEQIEYNDIRTILKKIKISYLGNSFWRG